MITKNDLIKGQLYLFIFHGKLCCGEFTGNYKDDKAEMKYNDTYRYVEVQD